MYKGLIDLNSEELAKIKRYNSFLRDLQVYKDCEFQVARYDMSIAFPNTLILILYPQLRSDNKGYYTHDWSYAVRRKVMGQWEDNIYHPKSQGNDLILEILGFPKSDEKKSESDMNFIAYQLLVSKYNSDLFDTCENEYRSS